ncbi:hypothetical protein D3C77_580440 [compost metagenome]
MHGPGLAVSAPGVPGWPVPLRAGREPHWRTRRLGCLPGLGRAEGFGEELAIVRARLDGSSPEAGAGSGGGAGFPGLGMTSVVLLFKGHSGGGR